MTRPVSIPPGTLSNLIMAAKAYPNTFIKDVEIAEELLEDYEGNLSQRLFEQLIEVFWPGSDTEILTPKEQSERLRNWCDRAVEDGRFLG